MIFGDFLHLLLLLFIYTLHDFDINNLQAQK